MAAPLPFRVAQVVLRCYPRAWRRRYAGEMHALLLESHSSWHSVTDLATGAIREWVTPAQSGWPTRSALTRASLTLLFVFYVGPIAVTWVSQVLGELVRFRAGALPYAAGLEAAMMWLAASTCLTTGAIRNGVALLRRSPRMPVMLGRHALLGLALLAFVAGVLESASRETASHFWLLDLMPYARAFSLGGLACAQSASGARLARLNQATARRLRRTRLLRHIGPTLGLGGGGAHA